jgi:tetratricopeptide (TPR) repeat protein
MVGMALVAFVCVLYVGFDGVYERLASLRDLGKAEGGRLQMLKDVAVAWTVFPLLGTGLGTHAAVYPMFDRSTITALAVYAENEYAQVLEETGVIGLGLLILLAIVICSSCFRNIRRNQRPVGLAAYGLCFGLSAVLIQSLADFGQHLPANAALSAIFCALSLVLAQPAQAGRVGAAHQSYWGVWCTPYTSRVVLRTIILLGVCALWGWVLIGANDARVAEAHWQEAISIEKGLSARNWQGTDAEYADLVSLATAAVDSQPNNVTYRHWLNVYRWRSICRAINCDAGRIVICDDLMPAIHDIVEDFHKTLAVCPTHGPSYSIVGQIEKFVLEDERGAERIRKGFRLAPCHPVVCFVAGWLDVLEGRTEDGIAKFEKAVRLDGSLFRDVAHVYVSQLSRPHLAIAAAGDDVGRLNYVVEILERMQYDDLAEEVHKRVTHLLEAKCAEPDMSGSVYAQLGSIYSGRQNNEAALRCYRQALAREYGQVDWRLELARVLVKMGKMPEAMDEAKICLQLHPRLEAAEAIVTELSVHPAVVAQKDPLP